MLELNIKEVHDACINLRILKHHAISCKVQSIIFKSEVRMTVLLKTWNSSLSYGQAALAFCLPGATSFTSYLMILLEHDLLVLLPIGQESFKLLAKQENLLVLD